jgi:hypothetical protein
METKKVKLLVDVSVIIEIEENQINDNNEILKAIRAGNITEVIAPYQLDDERFRNDDFGRELSWSFQAPMTVCDNNREVEITINEYDFTVCPECKSENLSAERFEADGNTAYQPCSCNNCLATWDDLYILTGYKITSNGNHVGGAE